MSVCANMWNLCSNSCKFCVRSPNCRNVQMESGHGDRSFQLNLPLVFIIGPGNLPFYVLVWELHTIKQLMTKAQHLRKMWPDNPKYMACKSRLNSQNLWLNCTVFFPRMRSPLPHLHLNSNFVCRWEKLGRLHYYNNAPNDSWTKAPKIIILNHSKTEFIQEKQY